MFTQPSDQHFKVRIFPEFGDAAIFNALFTSELWRSLFVKKKLALFVVLKGFLFWTIALFMSIGTILFRYQHGQRSTGFLLYLSVIATLIIYNSTEIIFFLKPMAFPTVLTLPFFIEDKLYDWVFVDIHSFPLLIFTGVYTVMGLVQCIIIYTGNGNPSLTKRGNSYLYLLLNKLGLKNELFVQAFLEPILLGIAAWFCYVQGDFVFSFVLGMSAVCVLISEVIDHAHYEKSNAVHQTH